MTISRRSFILNGVAASAALTGFLEGRYMQNADAAFDVKNYSLEAKSTAKKPLAPTPPLGWNSYDSYRNAIDEAETLRNLEIFAKKLAPHGYEYFVLDYGWYSVNVGIPGSIRYTLPVIDYAIDSKGYPLSSPTFFPNGIKRIADRAHELGVKFGLHLFRGVIRKAWEFNVVSNKPPVRIRDIADTTAFTAWNDVTYGIDMTNDGAQEYYNGLIQHVAELGVDLLKIDDLVPYPAEVEAIGRAIAACERDIVFSLSPGNDTTPANNDSYQWGHMLRITSDVWDYQPSIDESFERWQVWQGSGKPGFWPDMDMLCLGTLTGMIDRTTDDLNSKLTPEELGRMDLEEVFFRKCHFTMAQERTFLTMRAMAASPLFMGGCLIRTEDRVMDLITNRDVLACNQNGVTGSFQCSRDSIDVWKTTKRSSAGSGWIGLFNRSGQAQSVVTLTLQDLGLPQANYRFRNIWSSEPFSLGQTVSVDPNDVCFIEYLS